MTSDPARDAVLFVSLPSAIGGSLRSLTTVLDGLGGRCYRILAAPGDSWVARTVTKAGTAEAIVRFPGLDRPRVWRLWNAARLVSVAWRHRRRLAAVHANGLAELNIAAAAALVARRPLVVWVHDWRVTAWSRRLTPTIGRLTGARFLAVSGWSVRQLVEGGLARPDRVDVVTNPIDPVDVGVERAPEPGPLRVGFLGLPERYKGWHLLPAVADALRGAPVRLLVFSDRGTEAPDVWDELAGVADPPVELCGRVDDVRAAYRRCDVVICPSLEESFGRVAAEAMLNGIPVVASDIEALREVVGDAGLLVPRGDPAAVAAAVTRLAADASLRSELARRGRRRAERFRPEAVLDRLVGHYGIGS